MAMAQARGDGSKNAVMPIRDLLKTEGALARFRAYAPDVANPDRLLALASLAVSETPHLNECDPFDVLRAFIKIAALGLEINTSAGHAWVIPFKNRRAKNYDIQVIIGYQGFLELAYRSGRIAGFQVDVATVEEVAAGLFTYQRGTDSFVRHIYGQHRDQEDRDDQKPAFAYAIATFVTGHKEFVVMPWASVEKIRNQSSGYRFALNQGTSSSAYKKAPWIAFPWEMAMKTALRRLIKVLPKAADLATAQSLDEGSEAGVPISSLVELDPADWSANEIVPMNGNGASSPTNQNATDDNRDTEKDNGSGSNGKTASAKKTQPSDDGPPAGHPAAEDQGAREQSGAQQHAADTSETKPEPGATEPEDEQSEQSDSEGAGDWFGGEG